MIVAAMPGPAAVTGYVEALAPTSVLGWVWCPDEPELRLRVEAWRGDVLLASVIADRPRADLTRAGIGDGAHAFEFPLPPEAAGAIAEVRIVAINTQGEKIPIGAPPPPEALADRLDKMERGVDMLVGSQRLLHRNLQVALLRPTEVAEAAPNEALAALARRIDGFETLLLRLDAHLADLARQNGSPAPRPQPWTLAAIATSAAALLVSVWGLIHALPG